MNVRQITTNYPDNIEAVTPNDNASFPQARNIYVATGGTIQFVSASGQLVTRTVADASWLPCRAIAVFATGTTATGIDSVW